MTKLSGGSACVTALLALTLAFGACGADEDGGGDTAAGTIKVGRGITSKPCPGGATDRGCIYLGILSDLTSGPFAPVAGPITDGQEDFWERVNDQGGIAGEYDVNVTRYTRDNKYNPQEHVAKLREIEPRILALAQSLGTPMTLAGLPLMKRSDLVAVPVSWWSGWSFDDDGLVLESGYSYCGEALNGLDYSADKFGTPKRVLAVGYPGDYGGDSAAGAKIWGEANGVDVAAVRTAPNAAAGNQDAVVSAIKRQSPDVVLLATGPAEMAEIVGKAIAGGFKGEFIGSVPTFNPAVLKSQASRAILAKYRFVAPWGPFGTDSAAHDAMSKATSGKAPANDGYTAGWISSYPLKALLDQAAKDGDLTRAGVRKAVEKTTATYEGALPDHKLGGAGENVVKQALIAKPDPKAPTGASVQKEFFTGSTADKHKFTKACSKT